MNFLCFKYFLCSPSPRPPTPLPICELEPLTDAETEHAVQALQRQGSAFNIHISSPTKSPVSFGPASPSPEVPIPNPPPTPPPDIQPFTTNTDCHPHALSPAMPVLDVEPQAHDPYDTQRLSPFPDPYSLPPVLSPQVPYHPYNNTELHSEPPVLSPQKYPAEEAVEGHTCDMDTAESASQPVSNPVFPCVALTHAEGVKGSNQENILGFSGLECASLLSRRSRSLPRQSATAPNPKKRCRSASPEHSRSKRRRITVEFGSNSWTEQEQTSAKPERDIMAKPEGCLLFEKESCHIIQSCPKVSSTCTVETLGSKQTFTAFCVPTVQNFTQAPTQIDILGYLSGTSQSRPLCSKANTHDPPLQFPNDKSLSAISSQDSQRSLSHSTSVCIDSALIPDLAALSSSSSDSDWDYGLLSRLGPTSAALLPPAEQNCELDQELLHMPCTWMHDTSYESRLHTVLQPSTPATSLCGEEMDPSAFSRTVVQIVEVQH